MKGIFSVLVKTNNILSDECNWADQLAVTMPQNQGFIFFFFEKLKRWFPYIFLFFLTNFSADMEYKYNSFFYFLITLNLSMGSSKASCSPLSH
jgi:hypothetical protein